MASERTTRTSSDAGGLEKGDVMSAAEVARLLGCSTRQIYLLVEQGALPGARRLGRTVLVVRPVLEQWLLTGDTDD